MPWALEWICCCEANGHLYTSFNLSTVMVLSCFSLDSYWLWWLLWDYLYMFFNVVYFPFPVSHPSLAVYHFGPKITAIIWWFICSPSLLPPMSTAGTPSLGVFNGDTVYSAYLVNDAGCRGMTCSVAIQEISSPKLCSSVWTRSYWCCCKAVGCAEEHVVWDLLGLFF